MGQKFSQSEMIDDLNITLSRVELIGNHRLSIENHKGIHEYSDLSMKIALSDGYLHITGQNMEIYNLTLKEVTVIGTINSLEYIKVV